MKKIALLMIELYQKFLSPYKGYSCAHRIATGEVGCSGYGKKVISRYGFKTGYALLQRRFAECKCSSEELKKALPKQTKKKAIRHPKFGYQQGFCDADCGGCDGPGCDVPNCDLPDCDLGKKCSPTDFCDCCDIPDCGSKNKTKFSDEKYQQRVEKKMAKKKAKDEAKEQKKSVSLEKDYDFDGDGD